ncbi:hypothetical protein DENSPDRAFT_884545 [Dentipellis sp. KUC8613]|nr:hypothetical protein DENSPDRAFT_884545 [Dentipellis sp. KUC8613]
MSRRSKQRTRRPRVVTRSVPLLSPLALALMIGMIPAEPFENRDAEPALPLLPLPAPVLEPEIEEAHPSTPPSTLHPAPPHDQPSSPPPYQTPTPPPAAHLDPEQNTSDSDSEFFQPATRALELVGSLILFRVALDLLSPLLDLLLVAASILLLAFFTAYLIFAVALIATVLSIGAVVHISPYVTLGIFIAAPLPSPPPSPPLKHCCRCMLLALCLESES